MRRLLRVRMLIVLLALALIPAATLPFAERLRDEWTKFWEPEEELRLVEYLDYEVPIQTPPLSPIVGELPPILEHDRMEVDGRLIVPIDPLIEMPDA